MTTTALTFGQLEALWIVNGGSPTWAPTMAGIALAESGGNPAATNPSGATGLWQVEWPLHKGVTPGATSQSALENPNTNAQAAVALLGGGPGITAWEGDPVGQLAQNGKPLSLNQVESVVEGQLGFSTSDAMTAAELSLTGTAAEGFFGQQEANIGGAVNTATGGILGDITSASSLAADADTVLHDLTSATFWKRTGMGVLGVGLFVVGLVVFFESTDTGRKITGDAAMAAAA